MRSSFSCLFQALEFFLKAEEGKTLHTNQVTMAVTDKSAVLKNQDRLVKVSLKGLKMYLTYTRAFYFSQSIPTSTAKIC